MYSSMMTPVCTETPKSARKPTPEETLKCVPVISSASRPPMGAIAMLTMISNAHLKELNMVYRMMKMMKNRDGQDDQQARIGALLAGVFSLPIEGVAGGSLTCSLTFFMASSTVLPRSRPRTLYLMAM